MATPVWSRFAREPDRRGITLGSALCVLCRYRHKGHWTGATNRLARNLRARFGDEAYAMEELIAEFSAAFLCADLGIANEPRLDHAAYVSSWLKALSKDRTAQFTAANKASVAATYLSDFSAPRA
jgi:antirestriction protein ArdC